MTWKEPKTDWVVNPKNPMAEDFNRIEGNIQALKDGIEIKKGDIVNALQVIGMDVNLTDTYEDIANKIKAADQGTRIITPGTSNKTIPKGFHSGQGYVKGDSNLRSSNILSGKSIFGVMGNVHKLKWAEGSTKAVQPGSTRAVELTVRNLPFRPLIVCVWYKYGGYSDWRVNQAILVDKADSRLNGAKVLHAGKNDRGAKLNERYEPDKSYIYNDGFVMRLFDTTFGVDSLHNWIAIG